MQQALTVTLTIRAVEPEDLPALAWSGGSAHLRALAEAWQRTQTDPPEVAMRTIALPTGHLIAVGALDLARQADTGVLWMLSVDELWQSLGVGTLLISALETAALEHGRSIAALGVELDNPRAEQLYRRLGYEPVGTREESWPLDDGTIHHTTVRVLRRRLDR